MVGKYGTIWPASSHPHYKVCGCDEAGHIIPYSMGGYGRFGNMFAQNGNFNRGAWNFACNEIYNYLDYAKKNNINRFVNMGVNLIYGS
uniref:Type VII secretion system protein EssD-like domain-containing protein n=1 Tax=Panagrolaimus davidi TaxID=227884 RepID=A0A914PVC8_9BILA